MIAPCHDCTRRTVLPNCHASCEAYQAYNAERERVRLARQLARKGPDALIDHASRRATYSYKTRRK